MRLGSSPLSTPSVDSSARWSNASPKKELCVFFAKREGTKNKVRKEKRNDGVFCLKIFAFSGSVSAVFSWRISVILVENDLSSCADHILFHFLFFFLSSFCSFLFCPSLTNHHPLCEQQPSWGRVLKSYSSLAPGPQFFPASSS